MHLIACVCLFVHLFALSRLNRLTYDLLYLQVSSTITSPWNMDFVCMSVIRGLMQIISQTWSIGFYSHIKFLHVHSMAICEPTCWSIQLRGHLGGLRGVLLPLAMKPLGALPSITKQSLTGPYLKSQSS